MNNDRKQQQDQDPRVEKNETLKDPGARVADYGRAEQGLEGEESQQTGQGRREGNSSIPLDNEDTIGNP